MIKVVARLNPLDNDLVCCEVPHGATITDIVGSKTDRLHVEVSGIPIPREAWDSTFPDDEAIVTISVIPQGIIEGIIAAIMGTALSLGGAASLAVAGALGVSASTSVIAGIVGTIVTVGAVIGQVAMAILPFALPSLIRPQMPSGAGYGGSAANGRYAMLNADANPIAQYGTLPKLYGSFRITPFVVGTTYSTITNVNTPNEATQVVHVLLCLGYGPMKIGNYIIGPAGYTYDLPQGVQRVDIMGKNYPDRTNYGADTVLIGNTPIQVIDDAVFTIGTASAVINNVKVNTAVYNKDVEEEVLGIAMPFVETDGQLEAGGVHPDGSDWIRTSSENPIKISVDFSFNALYSMTDRGDGALEDRPVRVLFIIQYRRSAYAGQGPGAWAPYNHSNAQLTVFPGVAKKPIVYQGVINVATETNGVYNDLWGSVPIGQRYDVQVIRASTEVFPKTKNVFADATWTVMRSFKANNAANIWDLDPNTGVPEAVLMAVQISADSQLNGALDAITVMAQSVLRCPASEDPDTWNGTSFHWKPTSSPAWAYADVFTGPQLNTPLRRDKMDWQALIRWDNWCSGLTNTYEDGTKKVTTYNWYHTDGETMLDRVRAIVSCGRATWTINNALFSVIQDTKFTPVQMFSSRNSRNLEFTKNYPKIPNALRVRYVHPRTWQQAEKLVLDDYYCIQVNGNWYDAWGKTVKDSGTWSSWVPVADRAKYKLAQLYETLETQGVTTTKQAFREGRYHLANLRLRREIFTVDVDFENLVAQRGDCVLLSSDVLLRGRSTGRITKITPAEPGSHHFLQLDEEITLTNEVDAETELPLSFVLQIRCLKQGYTEGSGPMGMEFITVPLINPPGTTKQAWIDSSFADLDKLSTGDLFVFGPVNTQTILVKIVQVDYQADMSAKLTMVPAAPGVATADEGLIDEDDNGPDIPPNLQAPPMPVFESLELSKEGPQITEDGPKFSVNAIWHLQTSDVPTSHVEVWYRVGGEVSEQVETTPIPGTFTIKGVPVSTQVDAKIRAINKVVGLPKASEWTEIKTLITPDISEFFPNMPTNLDLVQDNYKQANGKVIYDIKVAWQLIGYSGGCELQWQLRDTLTPDKWEGLSINVGEVNYTIKDIKLGAYKVRVRNKSILYNDQFSAWNEGEIELQVYDYPPGPPTNLVAKSTPSGIMLSWDNPLDGDFAGIEIWENIANTRSADLTVVPPAPAASMLTRVTNPTNNYFHVPDDRIWHYYWIRSYDSEDGVNPTNVSTWERLGDDDGVRGRQGTFGDGLPPPPPINLVLTPDVWQITLQWEQSQEIPDLFGTQIYYSKTNDRGPDEALLATYLGVTDENFATHLGLEAGDTYYYWIRNIDVENLTSTWLPADRYAGAAATVSLDPRKYLDLLNGAITETQLAQSLLTLINNQDLTGNNTFMELQQIVEELRAMFVLKIQQSFEGLTEVSGFGMGSEVQNGQIVSQFLVQADRFAVGAPAVYNADEVLLVPIQYDWEGNLPTVYDVNGNVFTPYGQNGLPLPTHVEHAGLIRNVYNSAGERVPIYDANGSYFPTPRWDGFIVTTEEYLNEEGVLIPPGVYIRDANIAYGAIDGAKIRAHTITADRINTRGLQIMDNDGNVIFGANVPVNLVAMFGQEMADALTALKDKNIHLYIKNGVIGDLYIADELSSVDYSASYYDENNNYIPGTGWRIHRGQTAQGVLSSPSVIETDNLEARGTLSSDIYVPGSFGWKVFKDGSCEFNNGVFRGTLGAETLLVGTDFTLAQLSEQVLLASLNISANGQFFKFTEAGNNYGDTNLTFFVNNLDNITWSATSFPANANVVLGEDPLKPRYRTLNVDKMVEGVEYIQVRAQFQDRYDIVNVYPLRQNSGLVTVFASNARINLAADSRGTVANYANAKGKLRVFNGWEEVPKNVVTYSIIATSGCTATIVNDNTKVDHGYYKITSTSAESGSVTVRATYSGSNYDVIVNYAVYQAVISGTPGQDGQDGKDGQRGSKYFAFFSYDPGGYTVDLWTDTQTSATPVADLLAPSVEGAELTVDTMVRASFGSDNNNDGDGDVVLRDVVTLINYTSGYQETRMRTQTGWETISAYIAGNMLVDGTIYAKHIVASGITLSAGTSAQTVAAIGVNVETGEGFLPSIAMDMKDDFEAVHLFFSGAIQVSAGGQNTTVNIYFKKSEDGGDTWTTLGTQGYGVPGDPIPILLPYSYNMVVQNQPYNPNLKYRVSVKVPGSNPNGIRVYDRSFSILGTYR